MKPKIFIAILVLAFIVSSSFCVAQAQGPRSKQIVDIKIKGNYAISTTTILSRLKIKPGDIFEESALNKELKRLYATGYFADVFVETEDRPEGMVIIFTVVEKPVVEKIEFRGNKKIRSPRLAKKISTKEGVLLDFNLLRQDVAEIQAHYVEQGYSRVSVNYEIESDPKSGKAVVIFKINEGVAQRITSVTFEGNKSIPSSELQKYMATKKAFWFIEKGAFDQQKFDSDLDRIRAVYRNKGFLDIQVTAREKYSENGRDIHLTIIIDEGKQYIVGDVEIKGELAFPENEIYERVKVKPGDPFDYARIKEDVENVRALYYDRGYMNAEIDLDYKYNPSADRMDLKYIIISHDEVYVGKINVAGNTRTRDKVIRRELRVYPGEKFDGESLKKSKERIYNLGFFEDVYFDTIPTKEKDVKELNVTVKETKTGELSFGGGYSSVDAFLGFAQIRQRNFDILNFPTFTGGGQDLVIRGEMGSARNNYFLSWTDPWIFDLPYLFGFDIYRQEHARFRDSGWGYDETRMGGSLRLGKEITDEINTGLVYNLEEVTISNIPDEATEALRREEGKNLLSRLTWSIGYDTRDNKYSPTKGLVTSLYLENAGGFLMGDKDFIKGFGSISFYHSIIESVVLELRVRAGGAEPYGDSDDIPIYERFFAGGATTIRGYRQRGVGPRDERTNTALGGRTMLIGNAEVTFPIWKNLIKGAVFYDVGNVWEKAKFWGEKEESGFKSGAGVGVRVKTPIGPVKLDYGYPLNDNYDDKKEGEFYFSVSHGF